MFYKKYSIKGLLGASFTHVNAQYTLTNVINGVTFDPIFRSYSETKTIPIAKIMAGTQFTNNFGIRLSLQYQNMSRFKMTAGQASESGSKPVVKMKDAFGIGLGLTYQFN